MFERIYIFTATKAEAAPFINYYALVKQQKLGGCLRYSMGHISVIVTGIGLKSAYKGAQACQFLNVPDSACAFINIGIAGAKHAQLGTLLWPVKVGEYDVNPILPSQRVRKDIVKSVKQASIKYEKGIIYDMEAEGFCKGMNVITNNASLFCAKVISDNETRLFDQVSSQLATDLIRNHLNEFDQVFKFLTQS